MTEENFTALHLVYVQTTHRDVPLDTYSHYRWSAFVARGYTEADLRLVVAFINRRIKEKRRFPESLRLCNLLDEARWADDIADARNEARQYAARPTPRQNMLASVGRPEPERDTCKPASEIMAYHEQMAKLLKAWKESL